MTPSMIFVVNGLMSFAVGVFALYTGHTHGDRVVQGIGIGLMILGAVLVCIVPGVIQ